MLRLLRKPLHHYVPVRVSLVTGPTDLKSALKTILKIQRVPLLQHIHPCVRLFLQALLI